MGRAAGGGRARRPRRGHAALRGADRPRFPLAAGEIAIFASAGLLSVLAIKYFVDQVIVGVVLNRMLPDEVFTIVASLAITRSSSGSSCEKVMR